MNENILGKKVTKWESTKYTGTDDSEFLRTAFRDLNPYKPSVLFVGHQQTMQNQIKRKRLARFFTVCKQKFILKFE